MANQQIVIQLDRVKCVDETGGAVAERVGNDEIWLSLVGFDGAGKPHKMNPFEVYGNFDDGEVKKFSPAKTIFTLPVPDVGSFPKRCAATFILCEKGNGEEHQKVTNEKAAEMPAIIARAKADTETPVGTPPAGDSMTDEAIAVALKYMGGWVAGQIHSGINDGVFKPETRNVQVDSNDFHWGDGTKLSPEETIEFRGHGGVYYLTYYWEIQSVN